MREITNSGELGGTRTRTAIVFDDNPAIGKIAAMRVRQLGFDARNVIEKAGFVAALEAGHPDIVLLDLSLGDTDAVELLASCGRRTLSGMSS